MEEGEYYTPYNTDIDDLSDETRNAYLDKFALLPQTVKNILIRFSTAEYIEDKLGHDFILNAEQKRGIARVIRDVLLGDLYMGDMGNTLSQRYGIDWQAAKDIAQRIQIQLFTPALGDINRIQKEKFGQKMSSVTHPPHPSVQQSPEINPGNVVDLRGK